MGVVSAASISADTKDALARDIPKAAHCRAALVTGLALYGANGAQKFFVTHRNSIARLFWSLLEERKSHPIESRAVTRLARLPTFAISLPASLQTLPPKPTLKCDRLMEIRSAFLACGSLAAGAHGYHLEFVLPDPALAERLVWMLRSTGRAPKRTTRKSRDVLYYKDFEAIVDVLTIIGAFAAVLHLEDVRALRETKNRIHRLVNTEAANLDRAGGGSCRRATQDHRVRGKRIRAFGTLAAPTRDRGASDGPSGRVPGGTRRPLQSADCQANGLQPLERAEPPRGAPAQRQGLMNHAR